MKLLSAFLTRSTFSIFGYLLLPSFVLLSLQLLFASFTDFMNLPIFSRKLHPLLLLRMLFILTYALRAHEVLPITQMLLAHPRAFRMVSIIADRAKEGFPCWYPALEAAFGGEKLEDVLLCLFKI